MEKKEGYPKEEILTKRGGSKPKPDTPKPKEPPPPLQPQKKSS